MSYFCLAQLSDDLDRLDHQFFPGYVSHDGDNPDLAESHRNMEEQRKYIVQVTKLIRIRTLARYFTALAGKQESTVWFPYCRY